VNYSIKLKSHMYVSSELSQSSNFPYPIANFTLLAFGNAKVFTVFTYAEQYYFDQNVQ
jgi:hypothetical protein